MISLAREVRLKRLEIVAPSGVVAVIAEPDPTVFVTFMFADEWQDRADHGTAVANPTWDQVEQAITALDGNTRTLLTQIGIPGRLNVKCLA
jgi:hypothetical protein